LGLLRSRCAPWLLDATRDGPIDVAACAGRAGRSPQGSQGPSYHDSSHVAPRLMAEPCYRSAPARQVLGVRTRCSGILIVAAGAFAGVFVARLQSSLVLEHFRACDAP